MKISKLLPNLVIFEPLVWPLQYLEQGFKQSCIYVDTMSIQLYQNDRQQGYGQRSSPCNTLCPKRSKICQIWSFLGRYFSRYNFLIKNSYGRASKLIHCLYNRIKAIGNKAMVSALAPATLCAQKNPKFAKFDHFWAVISAVTTS